MFHVRGSLGKAKGARQGSVSLSLSLSSLGGQQHTSRLREIYASSVS